MSLTALPHLLDPRTTHDSTDDGVTPKLMLQADDNGMCVATNGAYDDVFMPGVRQSA